MAPDKQASSCILPIAIETSGEVLDGTLIDLIADANGEPRLLVWDGAKEETTSLLKCRGKCYYPPTLSDSVLQAVTLPAETRPHGSNRELLASVCKLVGEFTKLGDESASLIGRFILATWLVDAFRTAPCLAIGGFYRPQARQLLDLLHCVCRHPLLLTGVTSARLCGLPTGLRFTLLISQATISDGLLNALDDASSQGRKLLHNGEILDLYGAQVIHADSPLNGNTPVRFVQIATFPTDGELPVLEQAHRERIAADFQPMLLSFRRATILKARANRFNASSFVPSLREGVQNLAAVTPEDPDLQAEVVDLLREQDVRARSSKWIDLTTVTLESLHVVCHEESGGTVNSVYIGKLAQIAQEILKRRGNDRPVDAGEIGKILKGMDFPTEPRDARGVKLRITPEVCLRARQLARDLGAPDPPDTAGNLNGAATTSAGAEPAT